MAEEKKNRRWTEKEREILRDCYENCRNIQNLPQRLGRTRGSITSMASKMGLGSCLHNSELLLLIDVAREICGAHTDGRRLKDVKARWLRCGLPVRVVKLIKTAHYMIAMEDFWAWAEKHRSLFKFNKFVEHSLGPEPDWVKEKRARDLQYQCKRYHAKWTADEYQRVIIALKNGIDGKELEKATGRSLISINRILRKKGSRLRASFGERNLRVWHQREKNMLRQLILDGYDIRYISEQLHRSERSVKGYLYVKYKIMQLDKVREKIIAEKDARPRDKLFISEKNRQIFRELLTESARKVIGRKGKGG